MGRRFMTRYDFDDCSRMSHGVSVNLNVEQILLSEIPGAVSAKPSTFREDKDGTDWWVHCAAGHQLSVDVKVRRPDYSVHPDPKQRADDLALELWSDVERKSIGWTLRTDKRTDYILWHWLQTGRWCLVPFPMLCSVFRKHRDTWSACFKKRFQYSHKSGRSWTSQCVFVPKREVWAAIYRQYAASAKSEITK